MKVHIKVSEGVKFTAEFDRDKFLQDYYDSRDCQDITDYDIVDTLIDQILTEGNCEFNL